MDEKVYRFACDEMGIYEAVDRDCPRDDSRRKNKPDGAWLPKVGMQYSGAISFWTEKGLKKYQESELRDWHLSVVTGKTKLLIADRPKEPLYQDELQVICDPSKVQITREFPFFYEGPRPFQKSPVDHRPDFIRHYSSLRDWNAYCGYSGSDETFTLTSSIGKDLGLKRVGIHHEILKPNRRSSWPHAHRVEEEFVYILKGNPHVWLNGKLYEVEPGEVIFFPPGTGLAHTVVNHSDADVEMLVFGEQATQDDLIYYPLHPQRNKECEEKGSLWKNAPKTLEGKNSGEPGDLTDLEKGTSPFQMSAKSLEQRDSGNAEDEFKVFYKTRDLGRALGAKRIALHHQVLPSGFRSSLPHAESSEEEFVFVLKGRPIAWINGRRYPLTEGDSVAFPSGTGIAHTFINETSEDVELVVSGETTKKDNKCSFPLNPEANVSCGIGWENSPVQEMGEESEWPNE